MRMRHRSFLHASVCSPCFLIVIWSFGRGRHQDIRLHSGDYKEQPESTMLHTSHFLWHAKVNQRCRLLGNCGGIDSYLGCRVQRDVNLAWLVIVCRLGPHLFSCYLLDIDCSLSSSCYVGRCGMKEIQESESTKRLWTIKLCRRSKMRQPFGSRRELNIYLVSSSILDFSFSLRPLALSYGL